MDFDPIHPTSEESLDTPMIDRILPQSTETATFALGRFWGPDSQFGSLQGVIRTRVGYCGGEKDQPTYISIGDHIESIAIDFDPKVITYAELLEVFWRSHSPCSPAYKRQYMSAIFCENESQRILAEATKNEESAKHGKPVRTEIMCAMTFFLAEDYHQKYRLRRFGEIATPLLAIYPKLTDFVDSTAVTRLNGYVGGHGLAADFERELPSLGLSARAQEILKKKIRR